MAFPPRFARQLPTPVATLVLAGISIAVFVYMQMLSEAPTAVGNIRVNDLNLFFYRFSLIPERLFGASPYPQLDAIPAWTTLLTSMFLHAGLTHLIINMIAFISFGIALERAIGWFRVVALYVVSGVAGGLLQAVLSNEPGIPVVGASAAITGIVGATFLHFPRMRILLLIVPMPLWLAVAALVVSHVAFIVFGWDAGVAWWAHLGGLAAGIAVEWPFVRRARGRSPPPGPWD
jgi:membrane associated rhomboid family serine protease